MSTRPSEQARVDHLPGQARALAQAQQIRAYVRAVQARGSEAGAPGDLQTWSVWALAQADRIDPITSDMWKDRPAEQAMPS